MHIYLILRSFGFRNGVAMAEDMPDTWKYYETKAMAIIDAKLPDVPTRDLKAAAMPGAGSAGLSDTCGTSMVMSGPDGHDQRRGLHLKSHHQPLPALLPAHTVRPRPRAHPQAPLAPRPLPPSSASFRKTR